MTYHIAEDSNGNIILSHNMDEKDIFFQFESDKEAIKDYLTEEEKEDLDNGYGVDIQDNEPRASCLDEYWGN